jgi:hypothetical protein
MVVQAVVVEREGWLVMQQHCGASYPGWCRGAHDVLPCTIATNSGCLSSKQGGVMAWF